MIEFEPHDYFTGKSDRKVSRELFQEHIRKTYDLIRELASLIKGYDDKINDIEVLKEHVSKTYDQIRELASLIKGYDDQIRELDSLIKEYDDKINAIEVSGENPIYVGEENTEKKPLWIDTSDLIKGFVPVPPTDYVPNDYDPPTNPEEPPIEAVVVFDSREEELQFQKNQTNIYLSSFEVFLEPNREYTFYTNFGGSMPGDLWVSNSIYVPKQEPVVNGTATIVSNTNGSFVITGRVETDPDTNQANAYSVAHFIDKTYYFTITEVD